MACSAAIFRAIRVDGSIFLLRYPAGMLEKSGGGRRGGDNTNLV